MRAWRAFDRFEQRSSVRTWLYRIATNVRLTELDRRRRRPLPSGLGPPSPDPYAPADPAPRDVPWLEPVPDRLVVDEQGDPGEVVAARQSVRLALVAGLQVLPPRQRAAFILCDVLALSAASTTELLDASVVAVKSLLQRARARLADISPTDDDLAERPTTGQRRRVLDRYLAVRRRRARHDLDAPHPHLAVRRPRAVPPLRPAAHPASRALRPGVAFPPPRRRPSTCARRRGIRSSLAAAPRLRPALSLRGGGLGRAFWDTWPAAMSST